MTVKFVQFEPSGRVVEYHATLNHVRVLRDAGPSVDHEAVKASVEEGLRRDRAVERRLAGAAAHLKRTRGGPY